MKTIFTWILIVLVLAAVSTATLWYVYTQQYVQDSTTTATKGIFFKKTLNLEEYKRVSNGNGWLGNYDRWSRSDRHQDVLTIYCNQYCSNR